MSTTGGATILRHIRKLAGHGPSELSDVQLLQQFIADRDEAAFAAIVQRHGGMVLSVCRNVLQHPQDAEDAFQAAFLVLARKAHTVRRHEALSSWLHGVAYRLSLKVRSRRRLSISAEEREDVDPFAANPVDDLTMRELRGILHEELDRLGDKYRTPLLLCYWEGKTRDEAAEVLGITAGAFKKRLEHARNLLGSRLVRRGLVPSAAFFATLFSTSGVQAALPGVLIHNTAQAAVAFAVGKTVGVSGTAAALANGVIQTMNITKWATAAVALLILGILGTGLGFGGYRLVNAAPADNADSAVAVVEQNPKPKAAQPAKTDKERIVGVWKIKSGTAPNGEPLPAEVATLMRLTFTKDGDLVIAMIEEAKRGKYKIVEAGKIDLVDEKEKAVPGIYKFDGNDRLTLVINEGSDGKRPTEFTGKGANGQALVELERAKPGDEKPKGDATAVDKIREAAARQVSANNLKQMGLAFHGFHDIYKEFPAHAIYSKDGKTPLLSWRVAILPFIEGNELYRQFKLDEPWDSEHNKKLIPKMPKIYALPNAKAKEGHTHYQVIVGKDTVFDGAKAMKIAGITDGTSNTLLALEAKDAVVWTRPADLEMPKDAKKLPAVGTAWSNGFQILMCDGSVRMMAPRIDPELFRKIVTPAGGEALQD